MNSKLDKVFVLSTQELIVILAGKEIQNVMILQELDAEMNQAVVCQAMSRLYEKEFIHNKDGQFCLEPELEELLDEIKNANNLIFLRNVKKDKGSKVIYLGEKIVCLEQSHIDSAALKIYELQDKLKEAIFECFETTNDLYQYVLDEKSMLDNVINEKSLMTVEQIEVMPNIFGLIEIFDCKDKIVAKRIVLLNGKEKQMILCYDGENVMHSSFGDDEFNNILQLVLQGE